MFQIHECEYGWGTHIHRFWKIEDPKSHFTSLVTYNQITWKFKELNLNFPFKYKGTMQQSRILSSFKKVTLWRVYSIYTIKDFYKFFNWMSFIEFNEILFIFVDFYRIVKNLSWNSIDFHLKLKFYKIHLTFAYFNLYIIEGKIVEGVPNLFKKYKGVQNLLSFEV